jgi:hypothetical protein
MPKKYKYMEPGILNSTLYFLQQSAVIIMTKQIPIMEFLKTTMGKCTVNFSVFWIPSDGNGKSRRCKMQHTIDAKAGFPFFQNLIKGTKGHVGLKSENMSFHFDCVTSSPPTFYCRIIVIES